MHSRVWRLRACRCVLLVGLVFLVHCGSRPPKVLLIGIDGADWAVIDRLRAQGRLPALDGLVARGTRARLATITPTLSPALWTTIATGVSPAEHGIRNFVVGRPEAALILPELPAEDLVVRFEMRVKPPCKLDDTQVLLANETLETSVQDGGVMAQLPLAARAEQQGPVVVSLRLPDRCAPYWTGGELPAWGALKAVSVRSSLNARVVSEPPVAMLVREPGIIRPFGLDRRGALLVGQRQRPAKATDRRVPALWTIASAAERSVGVVAWWATYPAERVRGTLVSDVLRSADKRGVLRDGELVAGATWPMAAGAVLRTLVTTDWHFGPDELALFVPRDSPRFESHLEVPAQVVSFTDAPLTILKQSYLIARAYAAEAHRLLQGGQPDAFFFYSALVDVVEHKFWRYYEPERFSGVSQDDIADFGDTIPRAYAQVDRWIGELLNLVDEDTVVLVVSDHGHHAAPENPIFSGHHEDGPPGILLVAGPGVRQGTEITGASIYDIVPTVLAVLGLPVPDDQPGHVLDALFESRPRVEHTTTYRELPFVLGEDSVREDIDDSVRERLRSLGYL